MSNNNDAMDTSGLPDTVWTLGFIQPPLGRSGRRPKAPFVMHQRLPVRQLPQCPELLPSVGRLRAQHMQLYAGETDNSQILISLASSLLLCRKYRSSPSGNPLERLLSLRLNVYLGLTGRRWAPAFAAVLSQLAQLMARLAHFVISPDRVSITDLTNLLCWSSCIQGQHHGQMRNLVRQSRNDTLRALFPKRCRARQERSGKRYEWRQRFGAECGPEATARSLQVNESLEYRLHL